MGFFAGDCCCYTEATTGMGSGNFCPDGVCDDTHGNSVQVDLAGITISSCTEADCTNLNGTYVLGANGSGGFCWVTGAGGCCAYSLTFSPPNKIDCSNYVGMDRLQVQICRTLISVRFVTAFLNHLNCNPKIYWVKGLASPIQDCVGDINGMDIPFHGPTTLAYACEGSASTCTLTVL